jgi:ABC-type multidrug transport system ATPase subunit
VWCSGLHKRYGRRVAVDGVSFTVERGEVLGLLGPNGAGKTTVIKMLLGLVGPDAGTHGPASGSATSPSCSVTSPGCRRPRC